MNNSYLKEKIQAVRAIVAEADKMKNAYFFTPAGNASGRRSYEKYHSHPEIMWTEGGHAYTAKYTVSCSCKNVYASGTYTRDGQKTTLTTIKNSLKRMEEELKVAQRSATVQWRYTADGIQLTFQTGDSDPVTKIYKTNRGAKIAERKFFNRIHNSCSPDADPDYKRLRPGLWELSHPEDSAQL